MHQRADGALARQWAGTAVAVGGFLLTGLSSLPEPPVLHPEHLLAWWGKLPPVVAAVSLLRLAGLVCAVYWLLLCSSVILLTRSTHLLRLARLGLPGLGRLVKVATGGSLLGVAVICTAGCGSTSGGPPQAAVKPPELVPLEQARTTPKATPASAPLLEAEPGSSYRATRGPTVTQSPLPPVTATPAATPTAPPSTTATTASATSWTVRPGDDLWSITESVLTARLGRVPDQRQIAALWLRVIDANRADLPDPANPSLIFAGDTVTVPV